MKTNVYRLRLRPLAAILAGVLCVARMAWAQEQEKSFADMVNKIVLVPAGEPQSEMLAKATVAVNFIKRMELPQANRAINEALQLDARNPYLHFLNGFVYHLMARQGDSQKNEMAIEEIGKHCESTGEIGLPRIFRSGVYGPQKVRRGEV